MTDPKVKTLRLFDQTLAELYMVPTSQTIFADTIKTIVRSEKNTLVAEIHNNGEISLNTDIHGEKDTVWCKADTIRQELARHTANFLATIGTIVEDKMEDRWGNKISLILLSQGACQQRGDMIQMIELPSRNRLVTRWRLVRTNPKTQKRETIEMIFRGAKTECHTETLQIGPYVFSWGDGDFMGCSREKGSPSDIPELELHGNVQNEEAILLTLRELVKMPLLWEQRSQKEKTA